MGGIGGEVGRSPEDPGTESLATFGGFALGPGERPVRSVGPVLFAGEAFLLFAPVVLGDVCWLSLSGWGGFAPAPLPLAFAPAWPFAASDLRKGRCGVLWAESVVAGEVGSVFPWVIVGVAGGIGGFRRVPFGVPGPFPLLGPSAIACQREIQQSINMGGFVVKTRNEVVYNLYGTWNRPEIKTVTSTRPCVESAFAQGVNLLFRADRL